MSLDELRELCLSSGLNNDNFATRDIDVCYSLAMMTQVDELYKKRHMEMSFVEFIEAFARAADQADLPFSDGKKGNNLQDRIMNAFKYLIILCKPGLKETFVFPKLETIEAMKYRKP